MNDTITPTTKPTAGPWALKVIPWVGGERTLQIVTTAAPSPGKEAATSVVAVTRRFDLSVGFDKDEQEANGRFIVAACNGAMTANPENPMAAADALPDILTTCRALLQAAATVDHLHHAGMPIPHEAWADLSGAINQVRTTITRAEQKG